MKYVLALPVALLLCTPSIPAADQEFKPGEWVQLFNGKDLTGLALRDYYDIRRITFKR